ncbi:MAG: ABC transporter ATP-binding protein/permease [Oscillospiraceae bacterium]|jgi:ABC-type multidrug transport system fused ATPase/permease subunit|nr:ABC transporter ATP-binding protein/permease [Oscillospiraceae bacterium]
MQGNQTGKGKQGWPKNHSLFNNMMYVLRFSCKRLPSMSFLIPILSLMVGVLPLATAVASKLIISIVERGGDMDELISTLLILGTTILLMIGISALINNGMQWRFEYIAVHFKKMRINKFFDLSYDKFESPEILDLQRKALEADSSGASGVSGMIAEILKILACFVSTIASFLILSNLNIYLVVVMSFICVIRLFLMDKTKKNDKKFVWDRMSPYWRRVDYIYKSTTDFEYAKDIRAYNMNRWLKGKHEKVSDEAHALIAKSKRNWLIFAILNQFLVMAGDIFLYGYLVYSTLSKDMLISDFALYYQSTYAFIAGINAVFDCRVNMNMYSRQINDYRAFVDLPEERGMIGKKYLPKTDKFRFGVSNLSFKYPGREEYALKNVNLTISAGERLAIIGLNGAGKTTLIKLLLRLYKPTEGKIFLNGVDIEQIEKEEYYSIIAPAFQDVVIFALSFLENVAMCDKNEADEERVKQCIIDSGLAHKLTSLKYGLHTPMLKLIDSEGVDFSGGERQKLAFARALYKNVPIVIMDEPTAALDAVAEYNQYMNFDRLVQGKTVIYISHRLSSTRFCDKVAMFENGRLVEYGTHDELLLKKGRYSELYEVQAQYYKSGGVKDGQ